MSASTKRVNRGVGSKITAHRSDVASPRAKAPPPMEVPGLLAKLRRIRIDGPEDFAANIDQYLGGEK